MSANNFQERLLKDLRASAPKTAVLALLLLVGLYFWLPPLLKAFSGSTVTPVPTTSTTPSTPVSASVVAGSNAASGSGANSKRNHDSAAISRLLKECPSFQPASLSELPSNPFSLDLEQFPIPVLVTEEEEEQPESAPVVEVTKPVERLDGLILKSTILGAQRRSAWINNRLFHEGQPVPWNGQFLRLASVSRKSVTLTDGSNEWRLTLNDSTADVLSESDNEASALKIE